VERGREVEREVKVDCDKREKRREKNKGWKKKR
jgi:hypothetical protein